MVAKKVAPKGKPASKAKVGVHCEPECKHVRWVNASIRALRQQSECAKSRDDAWLVESHAWHEDQLTEVLERLTDHQLAEVPGELQEAVDEYVAQFAGDAVTPEDQFYDGREIYEAVLNAQPVVVEPYVRAEATPEATAVASTLSAWTDTSPIGMSKFARILEDNAGSASVQEEGLLSLAQLCMAASKCPAAPANRGLQVKLVMPTVVSAMGRFPRDADVQRVGINLMSCMISGGGSLFDVLQSQGLETACAAMDTHIDNVKVMLSGGRLVHLMLKQATEGSVERNILSSSNAEKIFQRCVALSTNEQVEKVARTAIPLLRG